MTAATRRPTRSAAWAKRREAQGARVDLPLFMAAAGLLSLGFVMVASASMPIGATNFHDPFFFVTRQTVALGLALGAGVAAFLVPIAWWERSGPVLFLVGLGLLGLVLVPGLGRDVNGATRWISLGPLNLQPSEFVKLFAVVYIAGYLVRHADAVTTRLGGFIRPMILIGCAAALMLMQPDLGTTAVMLATVMGLLFLGGVSVMPFAVMFATVLVGLGVLILTSPWRLRRVLSFLDPFKDPFNSGYQLSQALIAFGRGEWLGVGLGNGIQKQSFLPEAHTDFIASVIAEELGLLGMLAIICTFAFITWRAFAIGARAEAAGQRFAAYTSQGIGLWLGLQSFVNIGVNAGLLPTKGLTLPFISYGSNSLIAGCMAIAILLRIDATIRQEAVDARNFRVMPWQRA